MELVQAVVAANRYAFKIMDCDEKQFQNNIKKRKIDHKMDEEFTMEENVALNTQKTIYSRRWNSDVNINPIIVLRGSQNNNNNTKIVRHILF